jgi:HTH-type transcriptional regulator/antitoxin HipB
MFPIGNTGWPIALESPEDVGRAVRSARLARGLRQEDLALASGTGRRFIVDLERGKPNLRLGPTLAAMRALGIRVVATGPAEPDGDA